TLPSFLPLMHELFQYAVAGRLRERAVAVGDPLEEILPLGSGGLDVTVHLPNQRTESARTQDVEDAAALVWTDTDQSGIHRATIGNHPQDHLFAVNVPTATDSQQACESDLTRSNREDLRAVYPNWEFQLVTDPREVVHSGGPATQIATSPGDGMGQVVAHVL